MKAICTAAFLCLGLTVPALANDYIEFPVEAQAQAIRRSYPTRQAVIIPPYRHVFPVRVYTTPPQPPYYNVPPYSVVAPY